MLPLSRIYRVGIIGTLYIFDIFKMYKMPIMYNMSFFTFHAPDQNKIRIISSIRTNYADLPYHVIAQSTPPTDFLLFVHQVSLASENHEIVGTISYHGYLRSHV